MDQYDNSPELIKADREIIERTFFETKLPFLKEQNGLRPGKMHTLLGPTGAGKSTMMKTFLKDFIENNWLDPVAIWLSEESFDDFRLEMSSFEIDHPEVRESIFVDSDLKYSCSFERKERMAELVKKSNASLFILDNITTSPAYEGRQYNEQAQFLQFLKALVKEQNAALLLIAHTKAGVGKYTPKLIDADDVRGNKTSANAADFLYIMQQWQIGETKFSTMRVEKNRIYDLTYMWSWCYNSKTRINQNFYALPFQELKRKLKEANKL